MTESLYKAQPVAIEKAIDYAADSVVSKMLIKKETGNLTLFAFDKDQSLSEHTAPFDAAVLILDGTAEIVIGGHSHAIVHEQREGRLYLNPGECCGVLTGRATAALLDTADCTARIIDLAP